MCSYDFKFIDCYVGWLGSVYDVRVLRNFFVFMDVIVDFNLFFLGDRYIFGDLVYFLVDWLFIFYRDNGYFI